MPVITDFARWHQCYNPGPQRQAAARLGVSFRHYQELLRGASFHNNQPLFPSRLEQLAMLAITHRLDDELPQEPLS